MSEDGEAALEVISVDSRTNIITMRWLSFLMDKIDPEAMPELFVFYKRIGWMGTQAAAYMSALAEGAKPEAPSEEQALMEEDVEDHNLLIRRGTDSDKEPRTEEVDWRLTPEDHIKCWMFMMEIAGMDVDRNTWVEVDERISRFERRLADYYKV